MTARTDGGETVIAQIDNAAVTGFSPGDRVTITPRPDAALAVSAELTGRTRLPQARRSAPLGCGA